jgi:hypothetical protein
MTLLAHVGKIPVEEWLPFLVPVLALYLFGRSRSRRRRREVARLPPAEELLDERAVARVLEAWSHGRHKEPSARHVALMYPPGPDGLTATELAAGTGSDVPSVERRLTELHELGYLDLDGPPGPERQVALTLEGYDLLDVTEGVLLEEAQERAAGRDAAERNPSAA